MLQRGCQANRYSERILIPLLLTTGLSGISVQQLRRLDRELRWSVHRRSVLRDKTTPRAYRSRTLGSRGLISLEREYLDSDIQTPHSNSPNIRKTRPTPQQPRYVALRRA